MSKNMKAIQRISVNFILFIFLISLAGCSSKVRVMPAMQNKFDFTPKEHEVITAETRTLDKFIDVPATIAYEETENLSFKIDGCRLKGVYVKKDDLVEEGQLLAELDTSDLEYQIAERKIDLERLQLRYNKFESDPSMEAADKDTELEIIKLDMESVNLDIDRIKGLISKAQLIAPFSGFIADIIEINLGQTIVAYEKFMTISNPDSLMVISSELNPYNASNTIVDLSGIVTGMKVELLYGGKRSYVKIPATVTKIISTDPGVQANPNRSLSSPPPIQLCAKADGEKADQLHADRSITLRVNAGKLEDAVILPKSAIRGYRDDNMIKIMVGGKIINRRVVIGYEDKEEEIVVIFSGLRPGETVVMD